MNKAVCLSINIYFLIYKVLQLKFLGQFYFRDGSNNMQMASNLLNVLGSLIDMMFLKLPDFCKIIYASSAILSIA